jgi:hypothetical protein
LSTAPSRGGAIAHRLAMWPRPRAPLPPQAEELANRLREERLAAVISAG